MKFLVSVLVLAGLSLVPALAFAQSNSPEARVLAELLSGKPAAAASFSPEFLAEVPIERINAILAGTLEVIGQPRDIAVEDGRAVVRTAGYEMTATIALDADGKVTTLFLQPPLETGRPIEALLADMEAQGGSAAYLVTRNGQTLHEHESGRPLAVGSAFKLGILAALKDRIGAGEMAWTEIVHLEARQVSLPSGIIQTFPVGAPITLHTLAALMISISDNTATDILLDHVGRDAVGKKLGLDFVLKTRELFLLKADPALRARYLAADTAGKQSIAAELDGRPVSPAGASAPFIEGVEWTIPATTLCRLIDEVAGLDVMAISPGLARPQDWSRIVYKGGSEPGVLNMTTRVTNAAGESFCFAFTWNDARALSQNQASFLYGSVLLKLAGR